MRALVIAIFLSAVSAYAQISGPIRVLYVDAEGKEQTAVGPLH